jgi:hypothetical protein
VTVPQPPGRRRSASPSGDSAADRTSRLLDSFGIAASATCLAHCLLLPLLLASFPAFSSVLQVPEEVHLAIFLFAIPGSGWAILRGYRRHGVLHPLLLGMFGLTAVGFGSLGGFAAMIEIGVTTAGSIILAIAHLQNWRLRERCRRLLLER